MKLKLSKKILAITIFTILILIILAFVFKEKENKNLITICTDETMLQSVEDITKAYQKTIDSKAEFEITVLPNDNKEREVLAKKLRTQLMAGDGSDIYLMSDTQPERKIPFVEDINKTLYSGVWADLSKYIEKDSNFKDCFEPVMNAGKVDKKQYILPLTFDCKLIVCDENIAKSEVLNEENISTPIPNLIKDKKLGKFPPYMFVVSPEQWVGEAINYKEQELNVNKDDINTIINYGVERFDDDNFYEDINIIDASSKVSNMVDYVGNSENIYYFPMFTVNGKPFANVTSYGAISRSCKNKDKAYQYLKLFLEKDYMNGKGIAVHESDDITFCYGDSNIYLIDGIPVNKLAWKDWYVGKNGFPFSEEQQSDNKKDSDSFIRAIDQIEVCQFYSSYNRISMSVSDIFASPTKKYFFTTDFTDIERRIDKATNIIYNNIYYSAVE